MKHWSRTFIASFFLGITALAGAGLVAYATAPAEVLADFNPNATAPRYLDNCVAFSLNTNGSTHESLAELAAERHEVAWGMMYRTDLPDRSAMIFDMRGGTNVYFWMKNTPSSLDIAFFDTTGMLAHIEKSTTPFSEELVGPAPHIAIAHVLEVPAGKTDELGLVPGQTTLAVGQASPCPANFP